MIIDDIYLHLYKGDNIFYFFQLFVSQIFIMFIWISIRNAVLAVDYCFICLVAGFVEIIMIIYTIYLGIEMKKMNLTFLTDRNIQIVTIHDIVNTIFLSLVLFLLVFFKKNQEDNVIYGPTKVELLSKN